MREKANHNKFEAQGCFAAILICTLSAPLFVTLGEGFKAQKLGHLMKTFGTDNR